VRSFSNRSKTVESCSEWGSANHRQCLHLHLCFLYLYCSVLCIHGQLIMGVATTSNGFGWSLSFFSNICPVRK